ncbi:MAG TPA: transposase [Allosphingosinicella sp.]|jgi:putative transposase
MPRSARLVVPGLPHHVTQRGNQRQRTFFGDSDCRLYLKLLARWCAKCGTAVWAWCLMPNHVHLILVPSREDGLAAALGPAHGGYSTLVNARDGRSGHLWQGRFGSFVMDERHLLACARYVELNPVRAGLAGRAEDWLWSSARAHLRGRSDGVVDAAPLLERWPDWRAVLDSGLEPELREAIRLRERSGRPLGDPAFLAALAADGHDRLLPARIRLPLSPRTADGA